MPSTGTRPSRAEHPPRQALGLEQLVRFCLVGASGYLVDLAVFSVLVHVADTHYAVAAVAAFCVAWTNNFLWNKYWTFPAATACRRSSRASGT